MGTHGAWVLANTEHEVDKLDARIVEYGWPKLMIDKLETHDNQDA